MTTEKKIKHSPKKNFENFLTALFVTFVIVLVAYLIHIFQTPLSILNPFPPLETPTQYPEELLALAVTQTIEAIPSATATPLTTETAMPANTQEMLNPTATKTENPSSTSTPDPVKIQIQYVTPGSNPDEIFYTPTAQPFANYLYEFTMLHEAQPSESPWNDFVPNALLNCNWVGVGGQVFDTEGNPMTGVRVKLGGTFPDKDEFIEWYTTTEAEHIIGEGGYEFKLSDEPFNAVNAFWVQVVDEDGYAISAKAHFSVTKHCNINLIRIDFIQVK